MASAHFALRICPLLDIPSDACTSPIQTSSFNTVLSNIPSSPLTSFAAYSCACACVLCESHITNSLILCRMTSAFPHSRITSPACSRIKSPNTMPFALLRLRILAIFRKTINPLGCILLHSSSFFIPALYVYAPVSPSVVSLASCSCSCSFIF